MRMVMTKYDSTVYIFGVAFICFGFERGGGICMRGLQHIQKNLPSLRTAVRVCGEGEKRTVELDEMK